MRRIGFRTIPEGIGGDAAMVQAMIPPRLALTEVVLPAGAASNGGGDAASLCAWLAGHCLTGLRPAATQGQNLVLLGRLAGRPVHVKVRRSSHRHRLLKERDWLARAAVLRIPVPLCVGFHDGDGWCALVVVSGPQTRCRWRPAAWHRAIAPLAGLVPPAGWGPLRADGRPRWRSREDWAVWSSALADADVDRELLSNYAARAVPALIHGDLHRGNRAGDLILDWESVAVADPAEEAARLFLAEGGSHAAWAAAWGVDATDLRWRGACLATALEAVRFGGPRQAGARRFLAGSPP